MASPPDKLKEEPEDDRGRQLALWMERYAPGLRRYFARKVGPADADDLVHEVFLRLQTRANADQVDNVERYLFKTAKHILISRHRHERIDGLWRHDALENAPDTPDDFSPERILAAKQDIQRAIVAILNLPPRTRMAFEFHRFEKLSYAAIAERMGISKSAVQGLMERAIGRLADEFEGEIFGDDDTRGDAP